MTKNRHGARRRTTRWGIAALVGLLLANGGGESAQALATYRCFGDVTLEISGGPLDAGLLTVYDTYSSIHDEDNDPAFPSFVIPESDVTFGPDQRSARVRVASTGAANPTGGAEPVHAEGATYTAASFGIVNSTDLGFFLDVTIRGSFEYAASVDDGYQENAGTRFIVSHFGSALEGLHDPLSIVYVSRHVRPPLHPEGGPLAFDLATTTFVLGADENYSLLIPPSFVVDDSDDDDIVITISIYDVGIWVQAGGESISLLGGATSLVLEEGEPGPDPVDPALFPPPPFKNRPPVPACLKPVLEVTLPNGKPVRVAPGQGLYQVWAEDDIDPAPRIFLSDLEGTEPYGPFAPGDLVRIRQHPGKAKGHSQGRGRGSRKGAPWGFVENVFLNDVVRVTATDLAGSSATIDCPLSPQASEPGQGNDKSGKSSPRADRR
jgi:hypothetical protein